MALKDGVALSLGAVRYCGYKIEGPKVGRRVVAWRKYCLHRVKRAGERCWQHRSSFGVEC